MVHLLGAAGDLVDRDVDQAADLLGRAGAALGQRAHLARHHGEAPALLAGAGGLDGGIEGQQVGLEGDALDHTHDLADLGGRVLHLLHGRAQLLHGLAAARGDLAALRALLRDLGRRLGRLQHGAGQLLHRRGGLLQAARLRFGARRQVKAAARDLGSRPGEVADLGAHVAHHGAQVHLGLLQPLHERAQRLGVVRADRGREVAGRDVGREARGIVQPLQHRGLEAPQHPARPQHQQRHARPPGRRALQPEHVGHQRQQHQHGQHQRHAGQQRHLRQALAPAAQAVVAHAARLQREAAGARVRLAAHLGIKRLGGGGFGGAGLGAHRHVAARLAAFQDGRDVGAHPVVVTVLAAVLDQARPGLAPADGAPQVLVGLGGHVGVADDVVGLADELVVAVAAHAHEGRVAVGDLAFGVGAGHQQLVAGIVEVLLGHRQIDAHGGSLMGPHRSRAARLANG